MVKLANLLACSISLKHVDGGLCEAKLWGAWDSYSSPHIFFKNQRIHVSRPVAVAGGNWNSCEVPLSSMSSLSYWHRLFQQSLPKTRPLSRAGLVAACDQLVIHML
ncbi:hypothetical protein SAY87_001507 [Trapa incisa]|uniref:Uncharacterized protein n=1 Tax=Trapa incisa TaxID=236973 RepID=A0AAN7GGV4_9MYRT|nr:hypothetical protein SAY87_001507 [Trapa incisa]